MSKRKCVACGKDPAEGFASIWTQATGERFFCHGDDDDVSCYMTASWAESSRIVGERMFPLVEPTP